MRRLNPFANIPTIMTAEEIIEFAHNRSMKISMKSSLRMKNVERTRIREITRLQEFAKQVKAKISEAVEQFPSVERLHPFYVELSEILVGNDKLKQSLGAVYNCIPPIDDITDKHIQAIKLADDFKQMKKSRSAAKGRISSILRATAKNLDFIIEAKKTLSKLPGISPSSPTIVCAGFPNVGKSTLVKAVSTAEPEIAYYPFTTRKVIIGHLRVDNHSVQIVDTPGILDRPMAKRNEMVLLQVGEPLPVRARRADPDEPGVVHHPEAGVEVLAVHIEGPQHRDVSAALAQGEPGEAQGEGDAREDERSAVEAHASTPGER